MASLIDPTKPITGNATTQSVRDNFQTAADEISALQVGKTDAVDFSSHTANVNNPHNVTALQVGAPEMTMAAVLSINPYAISVTVSALHALPAKPNLMLVTIECLVAELGYAVGEEVDMLEPTVICPSATSSSVFLITGGTVPRVISKVTHNSTLITAARWKAKLTAFLIVAPGPVQLPAIVELPPDPPPV